MIPIHGINGTYGQQKVSDGTVFYGIVIKWIIWINVSNPNEMTGYIPHPKDNENAKSRETMKNAHM